LGQTICESVFYQTTILFNINFRLNQRRRTIQNYKQMTMMFYCTKLIT